MANTSEAVGSTLHRMSEYSPFILSPKSVRFPDDAKQFEQFDSEKRNTTKAKKQIEDKTGKSPAISNAKKRVHFSVAINYIENKLAVITPEKFDTLWWSRKDFQRFPKTAKTTAQSCTPAICSDVGKLKRHHAINRIL